MTTKLKPNSVVLVTPRSEVVCDAMLLDLEGVGCVNLDKGSSGTARSGKFYGWDATVLGGVQHCLTGLGLCREFGLVDKRDISSFW
ncbi:hypothetical protein GYH30_021170 [Glycine max]|nr:hypothetical protein GYH30_021170 [Glycine max]